MGCPLSHEDNSPTEELQVRNTYSPITERVYERRGGEPFVRGEIGAEQNGCPDVVPSRETYKQVNRHSEGPAEVLPAVERGSTNGYDGLHNIEATKRERTRNVEKSAANPDDAIATKQAQPYDRLPSVSEEGSIQSLEHLDHRMATRNDEDHRNVTSLADELRQSLGAKLEVPAGVEEAVMYDDMYNSDVECDDALVSGIVDNMEVTSPGGQDDGNTADVSISEKSDPAEGSDTLSTRAVLGSVHTNVSLDEDDLLIEDYDNIGVDNEVEGGEEGLADDIMITRDDIMITREDMTIIEQPVDEDMNNVNVEAELVDLGTGNENAHGISFDCNDVAGQMDDDLKRNNSCNSFIKEFTPTTEHSGLVPPTHTDNLILFSEDEEYLNNSHRVNGIKESNVTQG